MIGDRIKQVRLASGLTLDDLVEQLKERGITLSKQALSNYEHNKRTPKASLIMAIAKSMSVKSSYLLSEPTITIEWLAFRCQTGLREKHKESIKAKSESHAERHMFLQQLLQHELNPKLPKQRKVKSVDDVEKAASDLRKAWNLGLAPIDSLTQTIENQGGIVVDIPYPGIKFDGLSGFVNGKYPLVVVNSDVADDRIRFNLAHELSHMIMDTSDLNEEAEDFLAHRFAGAFLVPPEAVFREVGNLRKTFGVEELGLLKLKYGMSMQAWLFRLHGLNVITDYSLNQGFIDFFRYGWREKEPVEFKGDEKPVRLRQMTLRALSEKIITPEKAEELVPGITGGKVIEEAPSINKMKPSELMKLPREERQKILAQQAELAEKIYSEDEDLKGFDAFGEDDLND